MTKNNLADNLVFGAAHMTSLRGTILSRGTRLIFTELNKPAFNVKYKHLLIISVLHQVSVFIHLVITIVQKHIL
jgi:hypothetical protein